MIEIDATRHDEEVNGLDFSRCRSVWVPDKELWSPPPPHVREGVRFIIDHPFALLADDMGGMKTAQAIIAAQFLHDADMIDRVIVVAPAAIRSGVWFNEGLGQLREQVWDNKRNTVTEYHQRLRAWSHGPETTPRCSRCQTPSRDKDQDHPGICVCGGYIDDPPTKELKWICTNYEFIRGDRLQVLLPYCGPRTLLILDESSAVKGHNTQQTRACMLLRWMSKKNRKGEDIPIPGAPRCGRILLMNGTPVADSPQDMFSQGNLMHPAILDCPYITLFKARYAVQTPVLERGKPMVRHGKAVQSVTAWTNIPDLQARFAPYVLRREAKNLGIDFALPPVGLEVRLTEATWRAYKKMRDEMVVWLENDRVATSQTAAVKVLRLAQITSGFLGGIENANIDAGAWGEGQSPEGYEGIKDDLLSMIRKIQEQPPYTIGDIVQAERAPGATASDKIQEIGREKLDFALAWHAELLERYPDLKLVTWCRFVPELRRYLKEVKTTFNHPVGAACGEVVAGGKNVKEERETALRLLHPKTAPVGAATVGATQGTGSIGLNFTACRTVLDMSYDFSPWKKKQGDARFNRPGQTGPVSFFYLVAVGPKGQKTVDHHIMLTRLGKMNINDLTMAGWVKILKEE